MKKQKPRMPSIAAELKFKHCWTKALADIAQLTPCAPAVHVQIAMLSSKASCRNSRGDQQQSFFSAAALAVLANLGLVASGKPARMRKSLS